MSEIIQFDTKKDGKPVSALLCFHGWYQDNSNRQVAQWRLDGVAVSGKQLDTIGRAKAEVWLREECSTEISGAFFGAGCHE